MAITEQPASSATDKKVEEISLGSELCTQCGLCCAGALHKAAVLDPDEIAGARALGLPVLDREKPGFALPCPRLRGTVCTIYADRPRVCSRYKCQLLQDVESGAIEVEDALGKVRIAKELRREVETAMPAGMTLPQARELASMSLAQAQESDAVQGNMQLALRNTALNRYLDKHFRNSRDGRAFDLMNVGSRADDPESR